VLEIKGLQTGYGKKQVLFDVSLEVKEGEIVGIIGPNGSGKSTLLKAVCGLLSTWQGEICFQGASLKGLSPAQAIARGITFAPQGNRVFDELTVQENLEIGGFLLTRGALPSRLGEMLGLFPALKDRLRLSAGRLSGGEQQMVALARALVTMPKLLMLDEPSLGLSPGLAGDVFGKIVRINKETGAAVLIVEQKVRDVLEICHRVYSLKLGKVAFAGLPAELKGDKRKLKELFL